MALFGSLDDDLEVVAESELSRGNSCSTLTSTIAV